MIAHTLTFKSFSDIWLGLTYNVQHTTTLLHFCLGLKTALLRTSKMIAQRTDSLFPNFTEALFAKTKCHFRVWHATLLLTDTTVRNRIWRMLAKYSITLLLSYAVLKSLEPIASPLQKKIETNKGKKDLDVFCLWNSLVAGFGSCVSVYQSKHTVNETQRDAKGSFFELINGLFKELRAWLASLSKASFDTGFTLREYCQRAWFLSTKPTHKTIPAFFLVNLSRAVIPSKVLVGKNRTMFLAVGELCSFTLPWYTPSRPI